MPTATSRGHILRTGVGGHPGNKPESAESSAHGLRAQLQGLLPRHALFHTRVQIHQISSVPLVNGEFGVRWKFKNVQTKTTLLDRVRARHKAVDEKGKGREVDEGSIGSSDTPPEASSSSTSISEDQVSNIPYVVVSGHGTDNGHPNAVNWSRPRISSSNGLYPHSADYIPSYSRPSPYSHPSSSSNSYSLYSAPLLHSNRSSNSATPSFSASPVETFAPARGITPFYKLREHAVIWEQQLDVVVKLDIDRESSELLPNELKLVVMQRVIPGDPDAPRNPRLGVLYLDLSEYAGVGEPVTRRYLLRDSKTNATLKLTIYMEHVGGDSDYIAPPLPKGEILNGVAALLENDVYLTRPRALDLWGPYHNQKELELDLLGGASLPKLQRKARSKSRSRHSQGHASTRGKRGVQNADGSDDEVYTDEVMSDDEEDSPYEVPFDVSRLPLAYGPKTTEMLIEAIFNPVRVTEHSSKENPFTYYLSPEEARKEKEREEERDRERGHDKTVRIRNQVASGNYAASMTSTEESSSCGHSVSTGSGTDSLGLRETPDLLREVPAVTSGSGVRGWFKKIGAPTTPTAAKASRPGTPVLR